MAVSSSDPHTSKPTSPTVTETANCFSCGFPEDCTSAYISRISKQYQGRWLCGLCMEAVKDEVFRSDTLISVEEAVERHRSFCHKFREPFHEEDAMDCHRSRRSRSRISLPDIGDLFSDDVQPLPVLSGSCFSSLSS